MRWAGQANLKRVLTMSTEETQNPDLRDRGFIYWRLLSTDPESAKMIVNSEKPTINDDFTLLPESLPGAPARSWSGFGGGIASRPPEACMPVSCVFLLVFLICSRRRVFATRTTRPRFPPTLRIPQLSELTSPRPNTWGPGRC